jgi:hypothetical protein
MIYIISFSLQRISPEFPGAVITFTQIHPQSQLFNSIFFFYRTGFCTDNRAFQAGKPIFKALANLHEPESPCFSIISAVK